MRDDGAVVDHTAGTRRVRGAAVLGRAATVDWIDLRLLVGGLLDKRLLVVAGLALPTCGDNVGDSTLSGHAHFLGAIEVACGAV